MRGAVIPTLLAVSLGVGCTSRLMLETPDAGDQTDGVSSMTDGSVDTTADALGPNDRMQCSASVLQQLSIQIPVIDVMLVVGRDSSMASSFDWATRMSVTEAKILDVVNTFQAAVHFGYVEYPAIDGCGPGACCAAGSATVIRPAPNTKDVIGGALNNCINQSCTAQSDARPIDDAIKLAAGAFVSPAQPYDNQYIVLLADGPPYCYGSDNGQSCTDALRALQDTNGRITTFVVGVGGGVEQDDCLRKLATQGGTAGGTPSPVLPGRDGNSLGASLNSAVGLAAAARCVIDLTQPILDPTKVQLKVNKNEVPLDPAHVNGWAFRQGSGNMTIDVFGDACRKLQTSSDITVWQGCPPCLAGMGGPNCH